MDHPSPPPPADRAVVLFGKPGSGKGTQGRMLAQTPGLVHVDMGDLLREARDRPGIGDRLAQGELVPDETVLRILDDHLADLVRDGTYQPGRDLLLLDGVPRTPAQAARLGRRLTVLLVIVLRCDDEDELVHRLRHRGRESDRRDDEDPAVIARRLREYDEEVAPVLDSYPPARIVAVDALRPPLAVRDEIARHLRNAARGVGPDGLEAPR